MKLLSFVQFLVILFLIFFSDILIYSQNNYAGITTNTNTQKPLQKAIDYNIDSVTIVPFTPLNSDANDYALCIIKNFYFFTSDRTPGFTSIYPETKQRHENIFYSVKDNNSWSEPVVKLLTSRKSDYAIGGHTDKSDIILVYDGQYGEGDIFYYDITDSIFKWGAQKVLFDSILRDVKKTSAFLSTKTNELFFTADINNLGFGGSDIFIAQKLENGRWGAIYNIGNVINTSSDEEGVFYTNDTLYFSSKGHESLNKFDVYYTVRNNHQWSKPEKLPFPINSDKDDLYFYLDNRSFYISSNRKNETHGYNLFRGYIYEVLKDTVSTEIELFEESEEEEVLAVATQTEQKHEEKIKIEYEVIPYDPLYNENQTRKPSKKPPVISKVEYTEIQRNFREIREKIPEEIIYYRVQLAAFRKIKDIDDFKKYFPFVEEGILIEFHNADTLRFLINEIFLEEDPETYRKVTDLQNKAIYQYNIPDSFIAAYTKQGYRIAIIWSIRDKKFKLLRETKTFF